MAKLFHANRTMKMVSLTFALLFSLSVAAFAVVGSNRQRVREENEAMRQVDESPDQLLTVLGNKDCPLKIAEARVKEVSGSVFTKLTGKTTELSTVCSVPEVSFVNTSDQTV